MKILYLITKGERGGAQSHLWTLMQMQRFGTPVLALGEDGALGDQAREAGIAVFIVPHLIHPIHPWHDLQALREVVALIRSERPALIHAHTAKAGMIARLAGFLTATPIVFTVHAWSFTSIRSPLMRAVSVWLERALSLINHTVIEVAQFNFEMAERKGVAPTNHHLVIWNGVEDNPHRAHPGEQNGPLKIIMVARFANPKDPCLLLEALASLPRTWECTFVGDGPDQARSRSVARTLGIEKHVRFLGDRDDVPQLLAASDLFVLCSKSESLPISILEAMRAGLPVIASDVGGCAELVTDGVTGMLTKPGDVDDLRCRLSTVLASRPLLQSLGRAGRQRFESQFHAEAMVRQTEAAYADAVARTGRDDLARVTAQPVPDRPF